MGGQGMDRREALRVMALASVAAQFPGFSRWTFACGHPGAGAARPDHYVPRFFTPSEYATVERLADMIIPSDGTPGARETGVSEFIDFMVWSDPAIRYNFRYGLTWLEARAEQLYGKRFGVLAPHQQEDLLGHLAYKQKYRVGEEDGQAFFRLMREYTVMGFYATKAGLEELDCPALKHYYPGSPACPHDDDRAHASLPKAEA